MELTVAATTYAFSDFKRLTPSNTTLAAGRLYVRTKPEKSRKSLGRLLADVQQQPQDAIPTDPDVRVLDVARLLHRLTTLNLSYSKVLAP
ncbi:hypothetical protein [Streptomyces liangshanensis]|uniref:hypothetical protein n=1 Tax=Streptomyces liangshanensis TaxID=2717324 RepID=UPI0036DA2109